MTFLIRMEIRDSKVDYSSEEWLGVGKGEVEDGKMGERTNSGWCGK